MFNNAIRKLLVLSLAGAAACAESPTTSGELETEATPTGAVEDPAQSLAWVTLHEAVSDGGVTVRIRATQRSIDAMPEIRGLVDSEVREPVFAGSEVVAGAAWALVPQGIELVDPWRVELSWDADTLTAEERQTLTVVTEAEEGGWRLARGSEEALDAGFFAINATDLGQLALVRGAVVADFPAAPEAPVAAVDAAILPTDSLGGDKAIVAVQFRVDASLPTGWIGCVDIDGVGLFTMPKSGSKYSRFVDLDLPATVDYVMFASASADCSTDDGSIWPTSLLRPLIATTSYANTQCVDLGGGVFTMRSNITSASAATHPGTDTCPAATTPALETYTFRVGSFTQAIGAGHSVCFDIDGTVSVGTLSSGRYRTSADYLTPETTIFRAWESTTSACADVVQEFFPDNSQMLVSVTQMPTTACVDRPGGSADEVSFQVSLTGSGGVTVTGTQDCLAVECGNEAVQGTEECDDGNTADNDGCSATCTIEGCGDGTQQLSEACDDGNLVSGDGCSDICEIDNLECYDVDISFSSSSPLASADTNFWADGVTSTCGGAGRGDVSYLWTAPYTGIWEFNDTGSSIDTIVAIYSATSGVCGAELDCSNVIGGGSTVVQNADWEEEYVIVVSGSSADGAVTLDVVAPALPPSDTTTGPDSDDPRVVLRGTNFWNLGDSVTMDFTTGYPSITGLEMHLVLANNFLSTTRCRDGVPEQNVTVTVNGNTVGTFTVGPGDTSIDEVFSFAAISGPNYTVAYTTSAEVSSGCGSSGYATSGSTVTLVQ